MVVVGDQSAGKSSVLESLTGFHFPRSVTLCTRHATEIICRREETESIVVSIHAVDADEEQAKAFHRTATNLDAEEFAQIFKDVSNIFSSLIASPNVVLIGCQSYGYQVRVW
jgi:GTPase SAR1 family protein